MSYNVIMKTCNKCNHEKPFNDYAKDRRNKDGLQGICETCRTEAKRAYRAKRIAAGNPVAVSKKTCNRCDITKVSADFYKDAGFADGLSSICKNCRDESSNRYREDHRDEYNKSMRDWRAENREAAKSYDLMRCYGITLEDYDRMLKEQGGVCKLCGKPPKGKRPLVVDHCHSSETVRGLLCYGCNRLIVALDNHPLHDGIVAYLARHKA